MAPKTKVLLLVVEDEAPLANMYAEKLTHEGYAVEIAHDGLEGFEKMKLKRPQLVLMDIMMPNLNGLEALMRAKQDADIKDIPIIMLTNLAGTAELESALKKGAVGYIVKSEMIPSEVVKKVQAVLQAKDTAGKTA
jgi:CheY-like chemotaxis protein